MNSKNLVVDLDGTLIFTDLLFESLILLLKKNIFYTFLVPFWFFKGKAYLKQKIAQQIEIDVSLLPYNQDMITYIKQRKKHGDHIILATASHQKYANRVADFLGFFDTILATDGKTNLSSHNKAKRLVSIYGEKQFDYAGDHKRDIPVWKVSNLAILVNIKQSLLKKLNHPDTLIIAKKAK